MRNLINSDKKILKVFFILLIILFPLTLIVNLYIEASLNQIVNSLYLSLLITFFITGILAFRYYSKRGIISTKKIFKWFAITAAIIAPVFTGVLFLDTLSKNIDPNLYLWSNTAYAALIGMYIGMFFCGLSCICNITLHWLWYDRIIICVREKHCSRNFTSYIKNYSTHIRLHEEKGH